MKKNSISKAISSAACLLLCTAIFASCTFGPAKTVTSSVETTGTVNEINETNGTNETKTAETVKSTYLYELDGLGMSIFDPFAFVEENVKDDSGKALTAVETVYAGEKTIWILCKNDDSGVYACAYDVEKNEEVKKYRLDGASAKIAVYDLGDGGSDAVCLISTYVRGSGDTLVKNHFYEMRIPDASPENASFVDILDDPEKIESYIEDGFDEDFGFGWADPKYTKLDNGKYVAEVKNGRLTVTKKSIGKTLQVIEGKYDDYESAYIPTVFIRKFIGSDSVAFLCHGGDAEGAYIFDCVKEKTSYLGSFSPVRAGEWLICGDGNNSAAYAVNTALPYISRSIFTDRYKGYSPEIRGN